MAEAYRLAQWLTGNATIAEDVVQDPRCGRFAASRALVPSTLPWSLTIVRNPLSAVDEERPKAVVLYTEATGTLSMKAPRDKDLRHPGDRAFQGRAKDVQHASGTTAAALSGSDCLREMNQLTIAISRRSPMFNRHSDVPSVPGRQLLIALLGYR